MPIFFCLSIHFIQILHCIFIKSEIKAKLHKVKWQHNTIISNAALEWLSSKNNHHKINATDLIQSIDQKICVKIWIQPLSSILHYWLT